MTPEGAERLARRLHRYDLDDSGGPFVEHLARVTQLVREAGGGTREVMAAWLHGVPRAGARPADLMMRGVPSAVIRIIEAVAQDPGELLEPAARRAAAVRAAPGSALVLRAIISDRHRLVNELDQATTAKTRTKSSSACETRHSWRPSRPNLLAGQRARQCVRALPKPDRNRHITPVRISHNLA